jgi:hypothetical protein
VTDPANPNRTALVGCLVSAAIGVACALGVHPVASQGRLSGPRLEFQPAAYRPQTVDASPGIRIRLSLAPPARALVERAPRKLAPQFRAPMIAANPDMAPPKLIEADLAADVSADRADPSPPSDGALESPVSQQLPGGEPPPPSGDGE